MSLFGKYSGPSSRGYSLLDQPIGSEHSRVRMEQEQETRGNIQEQKRYQRVARRAYRQSMKTGNFRGAMDALDWIDGKAGGMNPGITLAGVDRDMAENAPGRRTINQAGRDGSSSNIERAGPVGDGQTLFDRNDSSDPLMVKSFDHNGPAEGTMINVAGVSYDNAKIEPDGGRWVDIGKAKPYSGSAPSLDSPSFSSRLASFGKGPSSAIAELQAKWMNEARANDPARMQERYERENGTPEQQAAALAPIDKFDKLVDKYADKYPGLFKLKGLSDREKLDSANDGKTKAIAHGDKSDDVVRRSKMTLAQTKIDIEDRKKQTKSLLEEVREARKSTRNLLEKYK